MGVEEDEVWKVIEKEDAEVETDMERGFEMVGGAT